MRRKSSRSAAKSSSEKVESPKPTRKSRRGKKTYSSDEDSDEAALAKYGNKKVELKDASEDKPDDDQGKTSNEPARAKDSFEENNDLEDESSKGKCNITNEGSATVEAESESETTQVTAQSPLEENLNKNNVEQNADETQQSPEENNKQTSKEGGSEQQSPKKQQQHRRRSRFDSASSHGDNAQSESVSPDRFHRSRNTSQSYEKSHEEPKPEQGDEYSNKVEEGHDEDNGARKCEEIATGTNDTEEKVPTEDSVNQKSYESAHDNATNKEDLQEKSNTPEPIRRDNEEQHVSEGKKDEQKQKKITLRRSLDEHSISEEKKSHSKKITLKRNIEPSNTETKEHSETKRPSPPREKDDWGSVYEKPNKEEKEKSSKSSRRITLKRSTTIEDKLEDKEKDKIVIKRRISVAEESSVPKSAVETTPRVKRRTLSDRSLSDTLEKPSKPCVPIKLNRTLPSEDSKTETVESEGANELRIKKHKWVATKPFDNIIINVDSLKPICPSLELVAENEINLNVTERRKSRQTSFESSDQDEKERSTSDVEKDDQDQNIIALNRKISIVDDTASKLRPPPSPAKNPVSEVLFITNLVRPFTVKQLRELLERTGKIKDEGFWTDRIKSKCYVQYESTDDAEATRNALHGINWPIGNGKKLNIEYGTEEDLEKAKNPPAPVPVKEKTPEKENKQPEQPLVHGRPERMHEDGGRGRSREERDDGRRMVDGDGGRSTREWDVGKGRSRTRSRERARHHQQRHGGRTLTPEDYHRKRVRHEEPPPQKMMDDLFSKTKATPSIYWQPLSPEEIAMKQQQRLVRMEEHKRRLEETRQRPRNPLAPPYRRR